MLMINVNYILYSKYHVLHAILPGRSDFNYNLRPKLHNLVLTVKSLSVTDRDFITRMIYKDFTDVDIPLFLLNFTVCMHV